MTEYYIPTQASETEFVEKRSRFIGHVWRVDSEEEARARIEEMKKRYYDARHNCWCYLIKDGPVRYSDDGEPQGTAGQPMLNVFQREGVVNVVCVVTRYFGGILLGAGGLVRAYTQSAKDALDGAGISVVRRWVEILLPCSYAQYERVKLETEGFGGVIAEADYGADIALTVLLPEERWEDYLAHMLDITAGTVEGHGLRRAVSGRALAGAQREGGVTMEGTAVNTLLACMENYNEAVKKMTAKLRPGDGLLGFGRDPKRDPCHMEFYEAVGEAVGRMVQEGLTPAEAEETVRFLVTLAQEERYFDLTQPMREAVQGHARTLVPLLEPETARELAAWYNKTYPAAAVCRCRTSCSRSWSGGPMENRE